MFFPAYRVSIPEVIGSSRRFFKFPWNFSSGQKWHDANKTAQAERYQVLGRQNMLWENPFFSLERLSGIRQKFEKVHFDGLIEGS